MSVELAIPDPRQHPVPPGWVETVAPAILEADWEWLDEVEARLLAVVSYVESFDGDGVEFLKALRVVEKRRGDLLIAGTTLGTDDTKQTATRWRKIARHWDVLWPVVRDAKRPEDVSQAALLRRVEMGVHYSSERGDWETPHDLFAELDREFGFELDVCATAATAKCARYFTPEIDGLAQAWVGTCFMNPPYGDEIRHWVEKAWTSSKQGATVVCLVPARVDTGWWWDFCRFGEVRFLKGRLRFGGGNTGAPFPSAVVVFPRDPQVIWWEL